MYVFSASFPRTSSLGDAGEAPGTAVIGGGVSLRIDAALRPLWQLFGAEIVDEVARSFEYRHAWEANLGQFPLVLAGGG